MKVRKLDLVDKEAAVVYQLLNRGIKGNTIEEVFAIGPVLEEMEKASGGADDAGMITFKPQVVLLKEQVYEILSNRFKQSGNWPGTLHKILYTVKEKIENAEKIEQKE